MGAALPDLQADLLRACADGDWPAFHALSALCDRLAEATFTPPMEGYVRRMLWAAAADGALPADACDDPWGPPLPADERAAVERVVRQVRADARPAPRDFERFGRGLPREAAAHVREATAST